MTMPEMRGDPAIHGVLAVLLGSLELRDGGLQAAGLGRRKRNALVFRPKGTYSTPKGLFPPHPGPRKAPSAPKVRLSQTISLPTAYRGVVVGLVADPLGRHVLESPHESAAHRNRALQLGGHPEVADLDLTLTVVRKREESAPGKEAHERRD